MTHQPTHGKRDGTVTAQQLCDGLVEAQALLSNVRARLQELQRADGPRGYDQDIQSMLDAVAELRGHMLAVQKRLIEAAT